MATVDIKGNGAICRRCGIAYSKLSGNFSVNYGSLYKGVGYLPFCKKCVEEIYNDYLIECKDPELAVRQTCRKLDLYWNKKTYISARQTASSRSLIAAYIARVNRAALYSGMSYDDTLREENTLWKWENADAILNIENSNATVSEDHSNIVTSSENKEDSNNKEENVEISDEVKAFWGPGNTPKMYQQLEQRYQYWKEHLPSGVDMSDVGVQAILRQICSVEIEINIARNSNKPTDKLVNTLNTLLGSAMLKPTQKKDELEASYEDRPLGVWLNKWENEEPLPEISDNLKDVNGIQKYIHTWVFGHLAHMLGVKNSYAKLYEDAIERLRVERPEYDDEDDDILISDFFEEDA